MSHAGSLPPAEVGVRPVGLCHLVQDVLLLDDGPLVVEGQEQLLGDLFWHHGPAVLVLPALGDHPLHGQEALPIVRQRDGHLGKGSTMAGISSLLLPSCHLQMFTVLLSAAEPCQLSCFVCRNWPLLLKWKFCPV